jgi:glycerophosphoryl diester phosphodiesterase
VLLMAHRGGEGCWPSNTLFAFQKALEHHSDVLELDIHSTADDILVVRHDPFVDSTTDGHGLIAELSLAEIKKLDAGYSWSMDGGNSFPFRGVGIAIPTLEEVFQAFPQTTINIDIKDQKIGSVNKLCKLLKSYGREETVVVGSFHDDQLETFRRLSPRTRTAAGVRETTIFYLLNRVRLGQIFRPSFYAFQIPEYSGRLHLVTPLFIRAAHQKGLQVHVWTVNEVSDILRLIEWGVDGLVTDYPNRLEALLGRAPAYI